MMNGLRNFWVILWICFLVSGKISWAAGEKLLGHIKALSPNGVKYIPHSNKNAKVPKVGDRFYNHDKFITDAKGRMLLEFIEGKNRVVLGSNSDLVIHAPENGGPGTSLSLNKGSVFSNVKKRYTGRGENEFRVVTDNGVAGVRGTKFLVTFVGGEMSVAVTETHQNRGVEIRKDINDARDVQIIRDHQAIVVNHGDQIRDLPAIKMNELPKEIYRVLEQETKFEGSVLKENVPAVEKDSAKKGKTKDGDQSKDSKQASEPGVADTAVNTKGFKDGMARAVEASVVDKDVNADLKGMMKPEKKMFPSVFAEPGKNVNPKNLNPTPKLPQSPKSPNDLRPLPTAKPHLPPLQPPATEIPVLPPPSPEIPPSNPNPNPEGFIQVTPTPTILTPPSSP